VINNTQGAVDLFGLIGQFIRPQRFGGVIFDSAPLPPCCAKGTADLPEM
jgi:hypothetical protein